MKRRFFAFFIVLMMVFQALPVMADGTNVNQNNSSTNQGVTNQAVNIDVYDGASLFSLQNHLKNTGLVVNVTSDFTVFIDSDFIAEYGTASIGDSSNPFMGTINGNNKTITLYVDIDAADWSLFHTLQNATIKDLNIHLYGFSSSSNERNVSVATLAKKTNNVYFSGGIHFEPETEMYQETNSFTRNIDIGLVALEHSGGGEFYIKDLRADLYALPTLANVSVGTINRTAEVDGEANKANVSISILDENSYINVYAYNNHYLVGGSIANLYNGKLTSYSNLSVVYLEGESIGTRKNNIIIGGIVGTSNEESEVIAGGYYYGGVTRLYLTTFGAAGNLTAGTIIGENFGKAVYNYSATSLIFSDESDIDDGIVSFYDGFNSAESNINLGGIIGFTSNYSRIHSMGINVRGMDKINIGNAKVNFGLVFGLFENGEAIIENNGISLISDEIIRNDDDSFGIFIGKSELINQPEITYNIVSLTDEHSFEKDYGWIPDAVGNISIEQPLDKFKNNYFSHMGYAVLNEPTQIFFSIPMNYHEDAPVEETDENYPFLITYDYLIEGLETNEYMTFNNPTDRGVAKLTITLNDIAAVKAIITVTDEYAKPEWEAKTYRNYDVLNILGENDDNNDNDDDDNENDEENEGDNEDNGENEGNQDPDINNPDGDNTGDNEDDGDNSEGGNNENTGDDENDNTGDNEENGENNGNNEENNGGDGDDTNSGENDDTNNNESTGGESGNQGSTTTKPTIRPSSRPSSSKVNKVTDLYSYSYTAYKNNAEYKCTITVKSDNTSSEECVIVRNMNYDGTNNEWDSGFVEDGFAQAVVNTGEYAGMPLPTYTDEKDKSSVLFNMYDLKYEIKFTGNAFNDISGNKYEKEIVEAANRLIIKGYGDGTFGPDRAITRAEFATMVVRTLGVIPSGEAKFDDVNEASWYYGFVNAASDLGIVVGIGNDLFAPEKNITRQEAAIMLMRAAKILENNKFKAYRQGVENINLYDYADTADWAKKEVLDSILYNIIDLRDTNHFEPLSNITRAETANALLNLLKNYKVINK